MDRTGKILQVCTNCNLLLSTFDYRIGGLLCPRCNSLNEPLNLTDEQLDNAIKKWHASIPKKIKLDKEEKTETMNTGEKHIDEVPELWKVEQVLLVIVPVLVLFCFSQMK